MSDLRSIMERGIGGAIPPPDGYERMLRRRERKQRRQRVVAGVVGVAFFAAAIWVVSTDHSSDRTQAPATTGPSVSVSSDLPPAAGLFGLPPKGATPSMPAHGDLVFSFMFGHGEGDPGRFTANLYTDGRLITEQLGDYAADLPSTGLVERRLTPEGVDLVRAAVTSTGLFEQDAHLVGYLAGLQFGELDIQNGGRLVRVSWGDLLHDGMPNVAGTDAQVRALRQLDAQLENPVSWLPASAWKNAEPVPYVPSRYSVCFDTSPIASLARILDSFPQPAEDMLRSWDRTYQSINPRGVNVSSTAIWCSDVTTQQARTLNAIFVDANYENTDPPYLRYVSELDVSYAHEAYISFDPQLPDAT